MSDIDHVAHSIESITGTILQPSDFFDREKFYDANFSTHKGIFMNRHFQLYKKDGKVYKQWKAWTHNKWGTQMVMHPKRGSGRTLQKTRPHQESI